MDTNYHDTYFVNEGECVAVATLRWTWHATLLWCSAMLGTVEVSRLLQKWLTRVAPVEGTRLVLGEIDR